MINIQFLITFIYIVKQVGDENKLIISSTWRDAQNVMITMMPRAMCIEKVAITMTHIHLTLSKTATFGTSNKCPSMGVFFWGYSGYSYSGLGITEYTEFQFRKDAPTCFSDLETESEVT